MFVKYGENLKEKPLSEDYFKGERILIRRIISRQFRVMATITDQDFVNKKDIYVFKLNDTEFASKYLLAIINSKLISFLKTNASNSAKKDDFTQLTLGDIREIRIPRISVKSQAEYVKQVDKIISNKIKGNDTNELESNLDLMIYKLYDLSENEIKTVEGN
ncbi:MAG: hypothetical protein IPJ32_20405 [Sphingobacteriaceae bacterium]|nr:hypothetical protein [Sphingobacteriaceae bacterium]